MPRNIIKFHDHHAGIKSILAFTIKDPLIATFGTALDEVKVDQEVVDMSEQGDIDGVLDDSLWGQLLDKVRSNVKVNKYAGAVVSDFGGTFNEGSRGEDIHGNSKANLDR